MQNLTTKSIKYFSLAASALTLAFGISSQALAHAHVVSTTPAADTVAENVEQVCIGFNSPLEPAFSTLDVFNAGDKQVNTEKSTVKNKQEICVVTPELESGDYSAKWVAVAADGHRVKGEFKFSVK